MGNKKKWDVLILHGDLKEIEILSSYIYDKSLGGYHMDDKSLYYFNCAEKNMVQNILEEHINKFNISFSWDVQEDEDWHLSWKDDFQPIKINNNLIIIPDWDKKSYDYDTIIKIKPGMAFGTGHHETTFLMLKHLVENIKDNDSILDLGSGSGILSIASQMYGAKKITAIEFDSVCRDNFFENIKINRLKRNIIDLLINDVLLFDDFNYDIILANINKNIIKQLIPKFQNTDAKIILSGLLVQDASEIKSLIKSYNMKLINEDQYNEWILMVVEND